MPDADAISQDAADDVAREESGTEHAPSVPPPAVADTSMELHGNDLKRQQPEPWDPPDQGSHERPLKRLRKQNTAEEAASLTVPSSLEDSLSEGSNHRAGAAAVEANHESAEERREQAEKEGGDPGLDVMGVEQEGEQEEGEQDNNEAPPDNRANDTICTKCDDGGAGLGQLGSLGELSLHSLQGFIIPSTCILNGFDVRGVHGVSVALR